MAVSRIAGNPRWWSLALQRGRSHGIAGIAFSLEESQQSVHQYGSSIYVRCLHSNRSTPVPWESDRCHQEQKQRQGMKGFTTSSRILWADLQVKVPPLGESITDGSVATVLKQEGDSVEEDDPLIQIETDKVTVDVRSPVAGVVKSILVQSDETVHVDSVVAVVSEGEAAGRVEGHVPVADTAKKQAVSSPPGTVPTSKPVNTGKEKNATVVNHSMPASSTPGAHVPSISFPRRRTPDGRVISELSAEEQMIIRNDELAAKHSVHFFMAKRRIERPPLPPRRELSDREMETVMLGGAE